MPLDPSDTSAPGSSATIVAVSESLKKLLLMTERVAASSAAILICGETGTGKEVVAAHLYRKSLRANNPFVAINCAAIPENLVESELFGYEKGAFSGADAPKPGMFELGNTGTVFLDEIGELDLKVQAKLLRVLDGAPFYRLGGNRQITTDARIIAATNRDLEQAVNHGKFRADLYHRIAQYQLRIPPLRERPDDILPLAMYFLIQGGYENVRFSTAALEILNSHPWPGNARELRNVVLQASVMANGDEILPEHLSVVAKRSLGLPAAPSPTASEESLDDAERATIRRALESCSGNHTHAAKLLGISRRTLLRKLKVYRNESSSMATFLGKISPQQHKNYRCAADIIAIIETKERTFDGVHIVNISMGGIGITGVDDAFRLTGELKISFEIAGGAIHALGRMKWAEPNGTVGIQFVTMDDDSRRGLQDWLRRRQMEEGWAVSQSAAPGSAAASSGN